jgi:hypothetical protein
MAETPANDIDIDEIWVSVTEAAQKTGYNYHTMRKLAWSVAKKPDEEREFRMRRRSYGWELWLPDLIAYIGKPGHGPQGNRNS